MTKLKRLSKSVMAVFMVLVFTLSLMNGMVFAAQGDLESRAGEFFINIYKDGSKTSWIPIYTYSNRDNVAGTNNGSNFGVSTSFTLETTRPGYFNNDGFGITASTTWNMLSNRSGTVGNASIMMMPFSYWMPAHYAAGGTGREPGTGSSDNASFEYYNNHIQDSWIPNTVTTYGTHSSYGRTVTGNYAAVNCTNAGMNHVNGVPLRVTLYIDLFKCWGGLIVNPNGGTWDGYGVETRWVQNCETTKNINDPVRNHYTFTGWNVQKRDNSNGSLSGKTFTFCGNQPSRYAPSTTDDGLWWSAYTVLTANWVKNPVIKFHGNGQTDYDMDDREIPYDETTNLPSNVFIKKGYTFMGWSTDKNAAPSEVQYKDEAPVRLTKDTDLYAIWQKNKTDLTNSNVLKNIEKSLEVNIVKVDEDDESVEPLTATFDIFEWSKALNNGKGGYKPTKSQTINSNQTYLFNYSHDNQGKWKVQEASVQSPYKNRHEEFEINMQEDGELLNDIPFYENALVDEDKGVFIINRGYEKGDIVRDKADKSGAKYYRAKRAATGKSVTNKLYWEQLNSSNYDKYSRLVEGAGKWNAEQKYARTFAIEFGNSDVPPTGLQFGLKKKNPSGNLLSGAKFNAYYTDNNTETLCRALNEHNRIKGQYYTNRDKNGDKLQTNVDIPIDDTQTHATLNPDGTKTLKLLVKEDEPPKGYKAINPFYVTATIEKDSDGVWQVRKNSVKAISAKDNKTVLQTIDNGDMFDFPELADQPYKVDIRLTKKGKNGYYDTKDLAGAVYDVFSDEKCEQYVTSITIGENGKGTATGLDFRDYWAEEVQAPASGKFKLAEGEDKVKHLSTKDAIKLDSGSTTDYLYNATVVDEEDTGMVIVNKQDEKGSPIDTAKFALYPAPDDVTADNVAAYDISKLKMLGGKAEVKSRYENIDSEVTWESKFNHSPFWESSEIFYDNIRVSYKDKANLISIFELDQSGNVVNQKTCGSGPFENIEYERQSPDNKLIVRGYISTVFKPESCSISVLRKGEAVFEDVPFGKYILAETDLPTTGDWTKADNQLIEVTPDNGGNTRYSAVTTSVLESEQTYCIRILKKDKDTGKHLPGAAFKIYDEQKKGYLTHEFTTIDNPDSTTEEELLFTTDENGIALAGNLAGGTYRVYEVTPPKGYLLDPDPKTIRIEKGKQDGFLEETIGGQTVKIPYFEVEFKDNPITTRFSKADITTKKEIKGGKYHVEDMSGIEMDSWTNNGTDHIVKGLVAGESYYYVEDEAPAGYTVTPPVEFTVNEDGKSVTVAEKEMDKVTMLDDYNKLEVYKKDIETEEPVAGAHLELHVGEKDGPVYKDADGEAKWISTTEPKRFDRIPNGTYTLVETQAPRENGYVEADSVTFEVDESNDVQTVTMYDDFTKTEFIKLASDTGEPQAGCRLQVLDKDRKPVPGADWITDGTPHRVDRLIPGELYYLHEVSAPDDYRLAEDVPFIAGRPSVGNDTSTGDDWKLDGTDFTDAYGNTHPYDDNKVDLPENPDDYVPETKPAEPIYTVNLDEYKEEAVSALTDAYTYADVKTDPEDTPEQIQAKTEMADKTVNAAVKIAVNDIRAAKDTAGVDAAVNRAMEVINQYYTNVDLRDYRNEGVVEEAPPDPDDVPDDIDYNDSGADLVTVTMLNRPKLISILKKNETDQTVDRAELSLFDSNDKLLYSWKTGMDVVSVFKLGNGTYRLHEEYAPGNYSLADDMTFEVDDDTTEIEYTMIDRLIRGSINVLKLDEKTGKPIEGVEFTLTGEDGTKLVETTDANGEIHFGVDKKTGRDTLLPQKYTLVETKSVGTTILKDPIEIDLPLKLTEAEAEADGADTSKAKWDKDDEAFRFFDLTYEVSNDATLELPHTGSNSLLYGILAGIGIAALAGLYLGLRSRRRKKLTK